MEQIVKKPRGRPPTDKQEIVKTAPRGRPPNKETKAAATPHKELVKAPRGRPPKETKENSMKSYTEKKDIIVKGRGRPNKTTFRYTKNKRKCKRRRKESI